MKYLAKKGDNISNNTIGLVMVISMVFLITACDEESKEQNNIEQVQVTIDQPEEPEQNEEESEFDLEEFSFQGLTTLKEDTLVRAKEVYFKFGSKVKINQYNFRVEAEKIIFENQSKIISFGSREYNACKKEGLDSGTIELATNIVSGNPFIDLAGQNAGQIGIYLAEDSIEPIDESHERINYRGEFWFKGCITLVKNKYPKDVPHLLRPVMGGRHGRVLVEAKDYNSFDPKISERGSHSSYEAIVEGSSKRLSWSRIVPSGQDGLPGEVCYFVGREYLCK